MSSARAADPKKGSKKKSGEMLNDFDKQMQWENNVMGPDDKKAELAKIARAQAITKAAAEKAAAEKAAAERNPPKEEARAKGPATKNSAPVLLATPEDENAGKSTKNREDRGTHDISPKLSSPEAAAPPPPVKPADDKFIDKLLKGEPSGKKKVAKSSASDDELNDLLAKDKVAAPKPKRGKGADSVDDLLRSAEKEPDMPAPKAKAPEWARVDPTPAPAPPPVAVKPPPKKDDGVIHVVQGAAGSRPQVASAMPARRGSSSSDAFDRRDADPEFDSPRKRPAAKAASFEDPFSDGAAAAPAARPRVASAAPRAVAASRPAPAPRREAAPSAGWKDPFSDGPAEHAAKPVKRIAEPKREAPAGRPAGWKDPFSDATPARTHAPVVAMREPRKGESTKWEVAGHHSSVRESVASGGKSSGWAMLKKQPHH
jgi:hypothetical protein